MSTPINTLRSFVADVRQKVFAYEGALKSLIGDLCADQYVSGGTHAIADDQIKDKQPGSVDAHEEIKHDFRSMSSAINDCEATIKALTTESHRKEHGITKFRHKLTDCEKVAAQRLAEIKTQAATIASLKQELEKAKAPRPAVRFPDDQAPNKSYDAQQKIISGLQEENSMLNDGLTVAHLELESARSHNQGGHPETAPGTSGPKDDMGRHIDSFMEVRKKELEERAEIKTLIGTIATLKDFVQLKDRGLECLNEERAQLKQDIEARDNQLMAYEQQVASMQEQSDESITQAQGKDKIIELLLSYASSAPKHLQMAAAYVLKNLHIKLKAQGRVVSASGRSRIVVGKINEGQGQETSRKAMGSGEESLLDTQDEALTNGQAVQGLFGSGLSEDGEVASSSASEYQDAVVNMERKVWSQNAFFLCREDGWLTSRLES